jgi:hypothetical protein
MLFHVRRQKVQTAVQNAAKTEELTLEGKVIDAFKGNVANLRIQEYPHTTTNNSCLQTS